MHPYPEVPCYYALCVTDGNVRRFIEQDDSFDEMNRRANVIHARPHGDARKNHPWATAVEVWRLHGGLHAPLSPPDKLVAFATWDDDEVIVNWWGEADDLTAEYLNRK